MKIYQLIYTSVKYSLSDPELGLINQPGYRVYSCTQGLTEDEINEIIRFCGYRLPKNSEVKYSKTPFDKSVPNKFPRTFRTFKTETGKYVAIQVVYSGYDWNGDDGNFFAHALIFDEAEDGFCPEQYYGSDAFRMWLTEAEADSELVRYLPLVDNPQYNKNLFDEVDNFVNNHKIQMSAILDQAMAVFADNGKTHLCISAKNQSESDFYVLGLKRILPPVFSKNLGIATNNIFLPSSGQNKIIINGTISEKNNISDDDIQRRTNCVYIDVQRIETDGVKPMKLFEMEIPELYESYNKFSIKTGKQLQMWINSFERLNEQGVGERLRELYDCVGESLFKERALSLYSKINSDDFKHVKFEILEVMFEHIDLFSNISDDIVYALAIEGIDCICSGEQKNIENIFKDINQTVADKIYLQIDMIMSKVNADAFDEKVGTLLLRLLSLIKSASKIQSWQEFFKNNENYISEFLELSAKVMINKTVPVTFTAPPIWTSADVAEVIALFDASTDDPVLKKACRKFILENKNAVWSNYGITLQKRRKPKEAVDRDIQKIKKMLTTVGYSPYQRSSYNDLKFDVVNEMSSNENPLLLIRLLNAVYQWQGCEGSANQSERLARKVAEMILEMRETQTSCYNFIFPKLALEILDSPGDFHEIMINSETMDESFWSWFYIGYKNSFNIETVRLNYERVAQFSKSAISKYPFYRKINKR